MDELSPDEWAVAEEFYKNGQKSAEELATQFNVSVQYVHSHMRAHSIERPFTEQSLKKHSPTKAIAYLAATRGPISIHRGNILKYSGVAIQLTIAQQYAQLKNLHLISHSSDYSSHKAADFFCKPGFIRALNKAKSENYIILVHDAFRLLAKLPIERAVEHFVAFATGIVEIIDTQSGFSFKGANENTFKTLLQQSKTRLYARRKTAKLTQVIGEPSNDRASEFAKLYAKHNREALRVEISSVIHDLKAADRSSLQNISEELNLREVKPIRADKWSKSLVANILKKLEIDHQKA